MSIPACRKLYFFVGAKQVSSASPAFELRGNKGKAGETLALPLHKHPFQTSFFDVFQLIQLALLEGDQGVEVLKEA